MPSVYRPTKTVGGKRRRTAYYWATFRGDDGQRQRVPLRTADGRPITDERAAQAALQRMLTRNERQAEGLADPMVDAARFPIRKVLADFLRHLRRKRRPFKYTHRIAHDVLELCSIAGISRLGELTAARVDVAMGRLSDRGLAPKTVNAYRDCIHALAAWAVSSAKILAANPVASVARREIAGDVRKVRRALTHAEAEALLGASSSRALVYQLAMHTGLRWGELAALRWADLDLESDRPSILLRAVTTKSKRADSVLLRADLAAALRAARPVFVQPTTPVFRSVPKYETFIRDCVRAGIVQLDDAGRQIPDERGRTIDRHGLRTTFISWLSVAGVSPREAMELARHTDVRLTLRSYTDPKLLNLRQAVDRLPMLTPDRPDSGTAKATGTAGRIVDAGAGFPEVGQTTGQALTLRASADPVDTRGYDAGAAGSIPAASNSPNGELEQVNRRAGEQVNEANA